MFSVTACDTLNRIAPSGFSQTLSLVAAWGAKVNDETSNEAYAYYVVPIGASFRVPVFRLQLGQRTVFGGTRRTRTQIAGVVCSIPSGV
jgi:hypothetical protein